MSEGTCLNDTPFYLNGEEVLCMRCSHCESYQIVYDELHHKDIFWAECHELNKCVGLPISVCKHFQKKLRSEQKC